MNCTDAIELLSAYYDGELDEVLRASVTDHLGQCADCQQVLGGFEQLSQLAGALTDPTPSEQLWERIETQLNQECEPLLLADQRAGSGRERLYASPRWLALASIVLVAATIGLFVSRSPAPHEPHVQFITDFGQYLHEFQHDPDVAQSFLMSKYDHQPIDPEEASSSVGYRPVVAIGLPPGYTIAATHVMTMPCCKCVQCLCRRADGSSLAIFEHDDEPEWFDDRPATRIMCQSTQCLLVETGDSIAASWRQGERHITLVGARDQPEVDELIVWFGEQVRSRN